LNQARPTPTVEDYLGVIYLLKRDQEPVISARLAERLDVSPPTVTATIKRMIRDGWVTMDERKEIHLTPTGSEAAKSVLRRHMLSELLLARMLDVPWSDVHEEADRMEHTLSRQTMDRIKNRLDDPKTCPHGNPLPGHEGILSKWVPLTETDPGQQVIIKRIHESAEENQELMVFLEKNGLMPGTEATVEEIIPFNNTLSLLVKDRLIVLGMAVAKQISVQVQA
jgi:DtxR family Mn-dependent transcriptional regulator